MESMPNRRQRRAMAKQAGYIKKKKNMSYAEQRELTMRAQAYGKQIHLANVERNLRMQEEQALIRESEALKKLVDSGYSQEEALRIFRENDGANT
jgi:hypothetical protein